MIERIPVADDIASYALLIRMLSGEPSETTEKVGFRRKAQHIYAVSRHRKHLKRHFVSGLEPPP